MDALAKLREKFQSEEQAKHFIQLARTNDNNMTWLDPRVNSTRLLRARPDKTLVVRNKQKVF